MLMFYLTQIMIFVDYMLRLGLGDESGKKGCNYETKHK